MNNGTGPFAQNATAGTPSANFDQNYQAINPTGNGEAATGSSYTVVGGDTLADIAQKVFGDANLWYVIANANGLSFSSSLAAGEQLSIPNVVINTGNTASTFKPYNPNAALGDVQPGAPIPPAHSGGGGCGVVGEIIEVVVAAAVAYFAPEALSGLNSALGGIFSDVVGDVAADALSDVATGAIAGAMSSVAAQGVGVAIGQQGSINWGSVGVSALSVGIGGGLANVSALTQGGSVLAGVEQAIARGVIGNTLAQGIGVATGLQSGFDWAGVAASGIGAGVGAWAGSAITASGLNANGAFSPGTAGNTFVSGAAGALASAATRSAITGTDFGDNIIATLPQVIGNTIGNLAAEGIASIDKPSDMVPAPAVGAPAAATPASLGGSQSTMSTIRRQAGTPKVTQRPPL